MSPNLVTLPRPDSTPVEKDLSAPSPAITMSQIKPRPLEWLWPGWLALGKLAVVDGDPEQGKSFVLLDLAARLSRGAPMPDCCETENGRDDDECETENRRNGDEGGTENGRNGDTETRYTNGCHAFAADAAPVHSIPLSPAAKACHPRLPVDITMLTAEDSLEDTVFPRLEAAGADPSRIHLLKSARLPRDLPLVEQIIQQTHSRLLIIDPGLADLDRHCLCLLADLADRLRCTVVIQRYLNKLAGTRAICRGGGSMSVIGAARTAMLLACDPREEGVRILASTKNNYGPRPASLRFVLEPVSPGICRVHWLGPSPFQADDLLAIQSAVEGKTAIAQAIKFLKEFLKDGPKATHMCYAEARKNQISDITLRRAKLRLCIVLNKRRNLLGLFIPATWELPGGSNDEPPHSLISGSVDEMPQYNCNDDKEFG